jgi:hypothetical protein
MENLELEENKEPVNEKQPESQIPPEVLDDFFFDKDKNGIPLEWNDIKEKLCKAENPVDILPEIFDFHMKYTPQFDEFTCYMLACSYFTPEELGTPKNRAQRKQLEARARKLMKKRNKDKYKNIWQFYRQNQDI